ncbi:hypothetical protein BSZ37_19905 [Rubrivirga marina]|uniref:3-keto-alpha-glucoside-1,2-lyase/3-keto-2-hydroxy-glucal hydratase domain-containing protein n=1 Tax=Rubrivirga marina TaxID=1196024 RepID=A0A271J8C3_9BACT|nr:hypothetical protein BSZ37_19905 [Rubrivirga marina]
MLAGCGGGPRAAAEADGAEAWTPLLDAELSEWRTYLSFRHAPGYAGEPPVGADGQPVAPVGYDTDPDGVFSVVMEDGEPVLRISGEVYGSVFTRREFADYHLRLKVRWGERVWPPRTELLRDSGVLYHSVGEPGVDWWRSWMLSQELQVMEGHMGDYWTIASSAADIRAFPPEGDLDPIASVRQPFRPFGGGSPNGGFCLRSADHESPPSEWTELELIAVGDRSVHVVNGHVVMVLARSRAVVDGVEGPLTRGRVQLQSEAAEVYYKDVEVRSLARMPDAYAGYFDQP